MARKTRVWLIILILVPLVICGGIATIVGLGVLYLATASEQEVGDDDRSVVLTVDDLSPWLDDFAVDRAAESISKTRYLDRSYEVEYEYEHPEEDNTLHVSCTVGVERTTRDARESYTLLDGVLRASLTVLGGGEVTTEENKLFRWGDQSRSQLLKNEDAPVGNYFICRKGTKVFYVMIVGVYFDDPDALAELLTPTLQRLDTYRP